MRVCAPNSEALLCACFTRSAAFATTHNRSPPTHDLSLRWCGVKSTQRLGLVACQEIRGLFRGMAGLRWWGFGFLLGLQCEAFVVLCLPVYVLHTDEKFSAVALFGFGFWHWVVFGLLRFSIRSAASPPREPQYESWGDVVWHMLYTLYGVLYCARDFGHRIAARP